MLARRMPRFGVKLRGVVSRAIAPLALASSSSACGVAEGGPETRPVASEVYEGPNFYEMEAVTPSKPVPPRPGQASIEDLPGFIGFVGEEGALTTCNSSSRGGTRTGEPDPALMCPAITRASINAFTFSEGSDTTGVFFGADTDVRGGTFFYAPASGTLASDVTGDDWHLYGNIGSISGFGLYLTGCSQLDASAFGGIEFSLWGSIEAGGGLMFVVGTAENQISHEWLNANKPSAETPDEPANLGRCIPLSSRYDGTCSEPRVALSVPASPRTLQVPWRELVAGCPEASVNARELTTIAWYFPQSAAGAYAVDIHIDNLRFTDATPL
jgi:hypothetical protein